MTFKLNLITVHIFKSSIALKEFFFSLVIIFFFFMKKVKMDKRMD